MASELGVGWGERGLVAGLRLAFFLRAMHFAESVEGVILCTYYTISFVFRWKEKERETGVYQEVLG